MLAALVDEAYGTPAVRELGHAHGGTVNDVVLAAVAGALRAELAPGTAGPGAG